MAVAMQRPRSTLWMAWVAAGALGTAVAASATQPGFEVFPDLGDSYWLPPALLAAPLALLQFLVLRGAMGVSLAAAGMWVGLTLVASVASLFATSGWYFYVPQVLPRVFIPMENRNRHHVHCCGLHQPAAFGPCPGHCAGFGVRPPAHCRVVGRGQPCGL